MSTDESTAIKTNSREKASMRDEAAAEAVLTAAEKVTAASKYGVEAGAEIVQFSTKAVQRSVEQVASLFGLAGAGEQVQDIAQRTTRNLDAVTQCGTALAHGGHELTHIWSDAMHSGVLRGVDNAERLLTCRTLAEVGAVQSEIIRHSIEFMMQNNLRLSESSAKIARTALERCRTGTL